MPNRQNNCFLNSLFRFFLLPPQQEFQWWIWSSSLKVRTWEYLDNTRHVPPPEQLFHLAPSLARTFPSLDLTLTPKEKKEEEEEEESLMDELCSEEQLLKHKGSHPIINIIKVALKTAWMIHTRLQTQKCESQLLKVKDKDVLEKYNNPTLFQFFPAINTQILIVGRPR